MLVLFCFVSFEFHKISELNDKRAVLLKELSLYSYFSILRINRRHKMTVRPWCAYFCNSSVHPLRFHTEGKSNNDVIIIIFC